MDDRASPPALDDVPPLLPTADDPGTGHEADDPTGIPPAGWRRILHRVWLALTGGQMWTYCGCVGFFGFLSLFPVLAITVLVYGLLFDGAQIDAQLVALQGLMPAGVFELLGERLETLAANSASGLTLGLAVSTGVAFWTGSRGLNAVIDLLNLAYHEHVPRGFLRRLALAIGMTAGALVGLAVTLLAVAALPVIVERMGLGLGAERATLWGRWPALALFVFGGLALLYRHGPNRRPAKWRWLWPGALLATVLWLALSVAFSAYVEMTEFYGSTFGALATAAVLMLWIYYSALAVGLGAVVNAEIEVQTRRDSTRGRDRPRGARGATVADRLPRPAG
ncbi:YihY/virulence factor BrkB family protein [Jannaschia sp. Os4]|uniref:YihY/virulence factor BrkB family protein n=1 Tax=Jannaschia sp. Os4 TaxID=2807617 RepID=UPI0019393414|nr:YihY/virulence factor BrkB family protein [Jannaschia sp. Os4]MBM2577275.1 YihY/virulence factor BrkB family protein [Jannaschia sp. Os4]